MTLAAIQTACVPGFSAFLPQRVSPNRRLRIRGKSEGSRAVRRGRTQRTSQRQQLYDKGPDDPATHSSNGCVCEVALWQPQGRATAVPGIQHRQWKHAIRAWQCSLLRCLSVQGIPRPCRLPELTPVPLLVADGNRGIRTLRMLFPEFLIRPAAPADSALASHCFVHSV